MIDFYTWTTPNGYKISIILEEIQLPYKVHPVDITKKEQFNPEFLKINPNNKIPAIVDSEGTDGKSIKVFESGAILIYLAEKAGKFLPKNPQQRIEALEWLMFQVSGLGPMLGQLHHFKHYAPEKVPYAIERYYNEAKRLYGVLNKRLSEMEYLAGEYSIADIACFPWIHFHERQEINLTDYPNVQHWYKKIAERPAVQKGLQVPKN